VPVALTLKTTFAPVLLIVCDTGWVENVGTTVVVTWTCAVFEVTAPAELLTTTE
jgi:hypothetical protein